MLKRRVIILLGALLLPLASIASEPYFGANSISPTLLSPPFLDKSTEQKKDIEHILAMQKNANTTEISKASAEREMSPEMIVAAVYPALKRDNFPVLYTLLDRVGETSHGVTDVAKKYWKTDRPYLIDKRIKPLIEAHSNHAYPSGHTSGSYTWAHVMGMLIPQNSKEFYAKAETIAQHRALVGMHFPHDLDGGKQLALLTVGGLIQNKEFLADLEKAKNELKAHHLQ